MGTGGGYMDIKYGDGLEFEVDDSAETEAKSKQQSEEKELEKIIRQGFRAPVLDSDEVKVKIGKKTYGVFNLSASGVGIILASENELSSGQKIKELTIFFGKKKFKLSGEVVHVSQDEAHFFCGIQLNAMSKECVQFFEHFLSDCKSRLFISK